jgi:hypothetical protein
MKERIRKFQGQKDISYSGLHLSLTVFFEEKNSSRRQEG